MSAPLESPARPAPGASWALVEAAQRGDQAALAELYTANVNRVFGFILRRVRTRQLAEDLTSETFCRALRRLGSVHWQGRDIGAWLITIARNLLVDYYKSSTYRREALTGTLAGDIVDADRVDERSQPETAAIAHEVSTVLLAAVARLTPDQRRVVELRLYADATIDETAQILGMNVGAVKAAQYRAVRALGRILDAEGGVR